MTARVYKINDERYYKINVFCEENGLGIIDKNMREKKIKYNKKIFNKLLFETEFPFTLCRKKKLITLDVLEYILEDTPAVEESNINIKPADAYKDYCCKFCGSMDVCRDTCENLTDL
jgi:hypothetical protein